MLMSSHGSVLQKLFRPVIFLVSNYKTGASSLLPACPRGRNTLSGVTWEGEPSPRPSSLVSLVPCQPLPATSSLVRASGHWVGELQKLESDPKRPLFFLFKAKYIELLSTLCRVLI